MKQIFAVVAGAVVGAIIEGTIAAANADNIAARVVCTLFAGTVGGLFGSFIVWRIAAFTLKPNASLPDSTAGVAWIASILCAAAPAAWVAAGASQVSARGYLVTMFCEAVALFIARQIWPVRPQEHPAA